MLKTLLSVIRALIVELVNQLFRAGLHHRGVNQNDRQEAREKLLEVLLAGRGSPCCARPSTM